MLVRSLLVPGLAGLSRLGLVDRPPVAGSLVCLGLALKP